MANYINGYSYPVVIIKDYSTHAIVEQLNLDLCGVGGLVESYEDEFKRNKLESGAIVDYDFKGTTIRFTLDYSEYVKKSNLVKIEKIFIFSSQPESYRIFLRPRADVQVREFEVRLEPEYELGILKGGAYTPGNRLAVIKFVTVRPGSKMFTDPDLLSVFSTYKAKF